MIYSQIIFAFVLGISAWYFIKGFSKIRANILSGKNYIPTGTKIQRIKNMIFFALGQKKMFDRPIVGIFHFIIYVGFLIINIELLEIVIDGFLGTHRIFMPVLGSFYSFVIGFFEVLALGVVISCVVFFLRRNLLKLPRFTSTDLKGWAFRDGNYILIIEVILMFAFLQMNAIDLELQNRNVEGFHPTGSFAISQFISPLYSYSSINGLISAERFYWWVHILGIFAFANYLPKSKHLHIILAFPNTFYTRLEPKGEMSFMKTINKEVRLMLNLPIKEEEQAPTNEVIRFGAKDTNDLTWKNLLEAYTCTECGRCSSVCPANLTGKLLSPRKIMMSTRDRMEEIAFNKETKGADFKDDKSLYGDYISQEELLACTTCNACVEACPVNINPLEIILELRRYMIMEESKSPQSWAAMFSNIETNFSPWKFPVDERSKWTNQ